MDTLQQTTPKARKEHRCSYCNGIIPKGDTYNYSTHVYEGEIYAWKSHIKCQKVAEELNMFDDLYEGLTEADFAEYINERFCDLQGDRDLKLTTFQERLAFVIKDCRI